MATRDIATFEHAQARSTLRNRAGDSKSASTTRELLRTIETAALFHDIGKLAIPDRLLAKPGPLTRDEYDQVKQHAAIGADLLTGLSLPGPLALLVRHHHENWDGTGYPDRLRGEDIPARRARARHRRLLRRADLGSTVSPRAVARRRDGDDDRAARLDVRPEDDRRVPPDRPGAATRSRSSGTAPRVAGRARSRCLPRQVRDETAPSADVHVLVAACEGARVRRRPSWSPAPRCLAVALTHLQPARARSCSPC